MGANPRIHVRISRTTLKRLKQVAAVHGVHQGKIVDNALREYFTPMDERPDKAILRRLDRVDDALERIEAQGGFQTDLLVEYIFEWLRDRPHHNPLRTEADDMRVKQELLDLTKRVAERSNEAVWN